MKFKFASHMYYSGRVTDGGGEEHEDHLFEVRKSITRNRKTSLVTGKQKKTGAFLTPKTYEIAGS